MKYEVRFLGSTAVPTGLEEKIRAEVDAQKLESLADLDILFVFDDNGTEWLCVPQPEFGRVEVEDLAANP